MPRCTCVLHDPDAFAERRRQAIDEHIQGYIAGQVRADAARLESDVASAVMLQDYGYLHRLVIADPGISLSDRPYDDKRRPISLLEDPT